MKPEAYLELIQVLFSASKGRTMAIFGFLNTRELEGFAAGLAEDLGRRFPPASEGRTDPGAKHQIKVILEGLAARAVRYHAQHKLGIYKKAKLANVFKWKLSELGYSADFVDHATKELVTRLAASNARSKKARS
jgi:hypothetical protein